MPKLDITVVNKHHKEDGEYIGRGSPLGNPWPIDAKPGETREVVIARYRVYLQQQIQKNDESVCNELNRLASMAMKGPLNLKCFCSPRACHGDVIKEFLIKTITEHFPEYTTE